MLHRTAIGAACIVMGLAWGSGPAQADRAEYTQETKHAIPIGAAGHISASTPDGHVTVSAYDGREVSLVVRKRVRTWKGAEEAAGQFDKMEVAITRTEAGIDVRGEVPDGHLGLGYGYSIDYELNVPKDAGVDLRTSDGTVRVDGVQGKVYAKTSDGDIAVAHVGPAEMKTSDGSIRAEAVEGDLSAITSDGDIRVSNIAGDVYMKSSDGDIDCREVAGLVVVQLSDGNARVAEVQGGISAKSSDGHLIVRDAAGPIELRTSDGDIELSLARPVPMSRVTCKSSDGNIRFKLNDAAAFTVEARTSGGRVNVRLPGEFHREHEGRLLEGHVNGGGPAVNLRTSDGSITIEPV